MTIQKIAIFVIIIWPFFTSGLNLGKSFRTDKTKEDKIGSIVATILTPLIYLLVYYLAGLFSLL